MNPVEPNEGQGAITRLTREELNSSHVDDLLARQQGLEGQSTDQTLRRGKWYFQNWFVLMLAGAFAALVGWLLVEPIAQDVMYYRGIIENVYQYTGPAIRVDGELLYLIDETSYLNRDGQPNPDNFFMLEGGQEVGVRFSAEDGEDEYVLVVHEISLKPEPVPDDDVPGIAGKIARSQSGFMVLFPVMAGLIGLAVGAADGIICRIPRRAILGGLLGFLVGSVGGTFLSFLAGIVYTPLTTLASAHGEGGLETFSTFGFLLQMAGRGIAWALAGACFGLGPGILLRSRRLIFFGLAGGIIGGLAGGLAFDPIDLVFNRDSHEADISRLVGFLFMGGSVGLMIGLVELMARDTWLQMVKGPLAGKEFLIFKDNMKIGAAPSSDIYLFNDDRVLPLHATLRTHGDASEIFSSVPENQVLVNGRLVSHTRLNHGDRIQLGETSFVFQKRRN